MVDLFDEEQAMKFALKLKLREKIVALSDPLLSS